MRNLKDAFDVADEGPGGEDTTVKLSCNKCGVEFWADFDMLRPSHVQYNLAESTVRVSCPNCDNDGATDENNVKLEMTRKLLEQHEARLQELVASEDVKFRMLGMQAAPTVLSRSATFECIQCACEFEMRTFGHPEGRLNSRSNENHTELTIVCPACGVEDTVGPHNMADRAELVANSKICKRLREEIVKLEKLYETEEVADDDAAADPG